MAVLFVGVPEIAVKIGYRAQTTVVQGNDIFNSSRAYPRDQYVKINIVWE